MSTLLWNVSYSKEMSTFSWVYLHDDTPIASTDLDAAQSHSSDFQIEDTLNFQWPIQQWWDHGWRELSQISQESTHTC